jgi:hypothetical protein
MPAGVPYSFSPGETIQSAQVDANFQALVTYINGLSIPTTPVSIANGGTGSNTAQKALTALGLAQGSIIYGTTAYSQSGSNGTLTFTGNAAAPAVSDYALGNFYAFQVPATTVSGLTELLFVDATTSGSGLAALEVYDNPGFAPTTGFTADAFMILAYEPIANTFVLLNPPAPASTSRRAFFSSTGTLLVPTGITTMYCTGAGPGGGGGSCSGTVAAGGGGGGSGAAISHQSFSTTPGHLLAINIGSAGAGGSGGAGSAGGTTTVIDSTTATTIFSLSGGGGGAEGISGSPTTGGSAGGAGGQAGAPGNYFPTAPISYGGAGGSCLLGAGGSSTSSGGGTPNNGVAAIMPGGGGSGGAGYTATGGNGGPSQILLEW